MKQPFKLPKINFEVDLEEKEIWINKILTAQKIMTFIKTDDHNYECYFSGMGVEEMGMLLVLFSRYPEVYNFFYSAVVNTELYKNDDLEGFKYSQSLEENLKKYSFF